MINHNLDEEDKSTDVLKLSVEEWCDFLQDPSVFDPDLKDIVLSVYRQPNHESTATDLGLDLGVSFRTITRRYVEPSKKIYELCGKSPQIGRNGQRRYWNTLFVLLKDRKAKKVKKDGVLLYRLILRPNLVAALERLHWV